MRGDLAVSGPMARSAADLALKLAVLAGPDARDAIFGVLEDTRLADGSGLGQAYFGNCLMHTIGQTMIRGQTCLSDMMEQGVLPERLAIVNVEGACATGSLAFHLAWKDVLSGKGHKGKANETLAFSQQRQSKARTVNASLRCGVGFVH